MAQARNPQEASLYFPTDMLEQESAIYGEEAFLIGLTAMRKTIERVVQGPLEQGLIRRPMDLIRCTTRAR